MGPLKINSAGFQKKDPVKTRPLEDVTGGNAAVLDSGLWGSPSSFVLSRSLALLGDFEE